MSRDSFLLICFRWVFRIPSCRRCWEPSCWAWSSDSHANIEELAAIRNSKSFHHFYHLFLGQVIAHGTFKIHDQLGDNVAAAWAKCLAMYKGKTLASSIHHIMLNFNKQLLAAGVFFGGILFSNTKKTAHWSSRLSFGGDQLQRCTPGTWRAILQIGSGTGGAVPWTWNAGSREDMPSKNMTAVRRKNGKGWKLWTFLCFFFGGWQKMGRWEEPTYPPKV